MLLDSKRRYLFKTGISGLLSTAVGELTWRGCYLGSNVSYNVKKMVENGYLAQARSVHDRWSIDVKLPEKGHALRGRLNAMHERHIRMLKQTAVTPADLEAAPDNAAPA